MQPTAAQACPYHQQSALAEPDAVPQQLAQSGEPANRANEQQGTVGSDPLPSSTVSTGGGDDATTGPANRSNEQQETVQGQQDAPPSAVSSGTSSMPPRTAPTGGPADRANEEQGTVK
jgi:hypothetical protein